MSDTRKIVIWGAGGHARVIADILRCQGGHDIVGFLDSANPERRGEPFSGASILGGQEQLDPLLRAGVSSLILAIGNVPARLSLAALAESKGFHLATAIHPRAIVAADVPIGAGTVIIAGAVVNPGAVLGKNVIINTCASVDHDCILEDGVHLSPGVHLGGKVTIGRGAWLALGVVVSPGITIGAGTTVGAGSVVLHDLPSNVVAYGTPAGVKQNLS